MRSSEALVPTLPYTLTPSFSSAAHLVVRGRGFEIQRLAAHHLLRKRRGAVGASRE